MERPLRILATATPHTSFLKISEGCDHTCAFCAIPSFRGLHRSAPLPELVAEARALVAQGVKELNIISQDSTWYGRDLRRKDRSAPLLPDLVRALVADTDVRWLRLFYMYPSGITHEIIELMAHEDVVLPYLDMPLQHANADVLRRMKRPASQEKTLDSIRRWREMCPDLTLRSTFIVGFPGETDAEFETLLEFLDEASLDRVGCFKYEAVNGAPANALDNPVPEEIKEERWHRFMQAQQKISARRLKRKVGTRQQVIIDEAGPTVARGRSMADAPEIDGNVYIASRRPLCVGEIVTVKIERSDEYDLHGSTAGF